MPEIKPNDHKKTILRLILFLKPHKIQLGMVLLFAILNVITWLLCPKIMGKAITKIYEGLMGKFIAYQTHQRIPTLDFHYIGKIVLLLIILYSISVVSSYILQFIGTKIAQKTVCEIRQAINDKLTSLALRYFDSHPHGDIMSRVTNDVDNISNSLQQSLTQVFPSICAIIVTLIMMLSISPILTLITLATLLITFIMSAMIIKKSQKYFIAQQHELGHLNGHIEEMLTGHKIVKAFQYEKKSIEVFETINSQLYQESWRAQFSAGIFYPLVSIINYIGFILICIIGGIYTIKNKITIGDLQAFIQYSQQFILPILQIANMASFLQSMLASAGRVFEILDETEQTPDREFAKVIAFPKGEVRFHNVQFGYEADSILMKNLNIDVKPGQTIAVVGPTGAGKTTLVNLLMRFYEINSGTISIDGVNIREMKRSDLRKIFGMVLQDTWLFNGTIKENIAYSKVGATDTEVIQAAKAAYADHFIRALPEGYLTIINEEASNISQGEKQLLTIARAILANPAILILDEATSNVDTRTEVSIQKAMKELMKGRTSFIIAHRLSTIREADLIFVMKHGDIVEMGNHQELLVKNGLYADLYNSQFTELKVLTKNRCNHGRNFE